VGVVSNYTARVMAEFSGGPHDGKRDTIPAHQCEAPGCDVVTAIAWIARTPSGAWERGADGAWEPTGERYGVYHLRHPEPIGGAYQYEWREGSERTNLPLLGVPPAS
jgi:hypothetical protein